MKSYKLKLWGEEYNVIPYKSFYMDGGALAVVLMTDKGEEFAVLTVNIDDGTATNMFSYVDTNNCPWAEKFLEENEIATKTFMTGRSGWCEYPMYAFDLSKLEDLPED